MKNLLVYCTQLLKRGGIESHVLQFCQVMSSEGVAVDLVVLSCKMDEEELSNLRSACRHLYINEQTSKPAQLAWLAKTIAVLSTKRYDSVYTNGQGKTIYLFGRLGGFRRRWVHHHHTSGDETDRATWPDDYFKVFDRADTVIACSSKNAQMISSAVGRQIDTIPCFSRRVTKEVGRKRKDGAKIVLGYYGRLIPEKGIELLCKLSEDAKLRHCEFHIWGVPSQYDEQYFAKFSNVRYHGPFDGREELVEVVRSIDVFLLLSVHPEGLPISLLEVTSSGTPWIASDRGGVPDIVVDEDFTILLTSSPSYDESLKAIVALTDKLKSENQSIERLVELYNQRFSEEAITGQWRDTLNLQEGVAT